MNKWRGQIGSHKGFCKFDTMEHGYRAALVLLHNYVKRGHDTIYEIISRWAPESENDTKAYIRTVIAHFNGYDEPSFKYLNACVKLPKDNLEELLPFLFELAWIMSLIETGYLALTKDCNMANGSLADWPAPVSDLYSSWHNATCDYFESVIKK